MTTHSEHRLVVCGDSPAMLTVSCELPTGHEGKHSVDEGQVTWEAMVDVYKRQVEQLLELVLDATMSCRDDDTFCSDADGCQVCQRSEAIYVRSTCDSRQSMGSEPTLTTPDPACDHVSTYCSCAVADIKRRWSADLAAKLRRQVKCWTGSSHALHAAASALLDLADDLDGGSDA